MRVGTTGWLILAYSWMLSMHLSGFGTDYTLSPKSDPPDYSVAGESTLGTLVIGGGTFEYRATPNKNIIRPNVYHSNNTKRSATAICRRLRHAEEIGWPQRNSSVEKRAGIVMGSYRGLIEVLRGS